MRTLLVSLSEHPLAMLRGIAELRAVSLASNVRDEAAAQLAAALSDEAGTAAAIEEVSPEARAAWDALRRAGGRLKAAVFARQHGEIRPVGPGRLEREATWREPAGAAEELWYRGLIFRTFADFGEGPMEYVYIPEDLPLRPVDQPARPRPVADLLAPTEPPRHSRHALNSLAVDTCTALASVREYAPAVDVQGKPDVEWLRGLGTAFLITDGHRMDLLLALALDNNWLATDRGRWVIDNQRAGAWLRLSHWEQMSLLFSTWRESYTWNDLRRMPGLIAEGEWTNDPPRARQRLLRVLSRLQPRSWYRLSDLVALMKKNDPDFQRPDGSYTGWYLRDAETGRYLSGFETWDAVEGRLLRFLIEGPLFWLGGVALDDVRDGGNAAREAEDGRLFRLTPAGAAWLASRMPQTPPRPAYLTVTDDFGVVAPLLLPLLDRFRLARFADPIPAGRWELSRDTFVPAATRHRITRGSLARARASGLKAEDAVALLRRAAGGRVPTKVATGIERYDQLGGQVRVMRGAVLRVADASTLAVLRSDPLIAPLLGELLSAQAAIVSQENLDRLLAILKDSGYSVEIS